MASDGLKTAATYRRSFSELRTELPHVFEADEEMLLDPEALQFVDSKLAQIDLRSPDRDPIGDAYEAFAGSELRSMEGQFFTPQNAVSWLVEAVNPLPGEKIIDPACGAGGFLAFTAKHLVKNGSSGEDVSAAIFGLEKDQYLTTLAHAHLSLITLEPASVVCADSLAMRDLDGGDIASDYIEKFDVVLANPPFGSKIISASDEVRRKFELAYKWKFFKGAENLIKTAELARMSPPQVLFVERILSLVKPGGRIGLVIPESLVSNKSYAPVVNFIRKNSSIQAVVGMPENLFKTSGKGGTHTKTCLLVLTKNRKGHQENVPVFFAEARWCGNDSRGNKTDRDDLPEILREFKAGYESPTKIGYWLDNSDIKNNILTPRYYDPSSSQIIKDNSETHEPVLVSSLIANGVLEIRTGDEIGKLAYGTGSIPFVRTSDISNWEIKVDPKHGVSEQIYSSLSRKQDVRAGDILMVRDGTYLIGTCAMVTKYDLKILYQSHILKIRSLDHDRLSPHLLLALLSCDPVQAQIKAKRFTQDIIDTLGDRLLELVLPIPRDKKHRELIESSVEHAIKDRIEARELSRRARAGVMEMDALQLREEEPIVVGDVLH